MLKIRKYFYKIDKVFDLSNDFKKIKTFQQKKNRVRYTVFRFLVEVRGFAHQRLLPKVNRVQPKGVHTA